MKEKVGRIHLVRTVGIIESTTPTRPLTLEQLQKMVGGYVEQVKVQYEGRRLYACIDEEGKLKLKEPNVMATLMYRTANPGSNQIIVGDMVILDGVKWHG